MGVQWVGAAGGGNELSTPHPLPICIQTFGIKNRTKLETHCQKQLWRCPGKHPVKTASGQWDAARESPIPLLQRGHATRYGDGHCWNCCAAVDGFRASLCRKSSRIETASNTHAAGWANMAFRQVLEPGVCSPSTARGSYLLQGLHEGSLSAPPRPPQPRWKLSWARTLSPPAGLVFLHRWRRRPGGHVPTTTPRPLCPAFLISKPATVAFAPSDLTFVVGCRCPSRVPAPQRQLAHQS